MFNRKLSPLLIVSVIMIAIIAIGLLRPGIISFFTVLIALCFT
jgi:hypothetical protein